MTSEEILILLEKEIQNNLVIKDFDIIEVDYNVGYRTKFIYRYKNKQFLICFGLVQKSNTNSDALKIWVKKNNDERDNFSIQYSLNNANVKQNTEVTEIKENYRLTIGTNISKEDQVILREKMIEGGFNQSDTIISINNEIEKNNWNTVFEDLFKWINIRIEAKDELRSIIENRNGVSNKSSKKDIPNNKGAQNMQNKNTILYGPPGTGKTYHTITHAVSILKNIPFNQLELQSKNKEERFKIKNDFDGFIKQGRIVFSTFHQSLGYEDFIEGIKPKAPVTEGDPMSYIVEDGIFKQLCIIASHEYATKDKTVVHENINDFSNSYNIYIDSIFDQLNQGINPEIDLRNGGKLVIENITPNNNIDLKHLNGERNYTVSKQRLNKLSIAFPDLDKVTNINDQFRSVIGGSNSSAYWAVLQAIRQQSKNASLETKEFEVIVEDNYEGKKSIVEVISKENYKQTLDKPYILIIDEINRGNVSQIFGELITLIEDDKRLGKEEALEVTLPYSKEKFGVPQNLYIIGTMNTADRSVEALDTALRRRFSFVPMMPNEKLLTADLEGIDLQLMLTTMNNRLRILKDGDHTIGHAWLMGIQSLSELQKAFSNKILPLLQEYFYNDYEKLGLVLGDAFFEKDGKNFKKVDGGEFAKFSANDGLAQQYQSKYLFKLREASALEVDDFVSIYSGQQSNEE